MLALFFVAFTLGEMTSPEACAEDLLGLPHELFAAAASDGTAEQVVDRESWPAPADESDERAPDEDCFCCCPHLIVRPHFSLVLDPVGREPLKPTHVRLPAGLDPPCFHPPRVA